MANKNPELRYDLVEKGYIPLDKSWMNRVGTLDMIHDYDDTLEFLGNRIERTCELSDDMKALYHVSIQWRLAGEIHVGESGTLYRFMRFATWKLGKNLPIIKDGTLEDRQMCDDPAIVNWSLEKLLTLDKGTSQWASASVLLGNQERIPNPPYKLQLTYDAVDHWNAKRAEGLCWEPRDDMTILAQATSYINWLRKGARAGMMYFKPEQAEDYCFARAFDLITPEEGQLRWPSLVEHESNRIKEMEEQLRQEEITSKDHRVIQAITMLRQSSKNVENPDSVNKSWPQFWKFLAHSQKL